VFSRDFVKATSLVSLNISRRFAHAPTILLRWFFVIRVSLHVPDETFLLTQLLETPYHLLHGFAGSRLNFQHTKDTFPCFRSAKQQQKNITSDYFVKKRLADYCNARRREFQAKKISE